MLAEKSLDKEGYSVTTRETGQEVSKISFDHQKNRKIKSERDRSENGGKGGGGTRTVFWLLYGGKQDVNK